MPIRKARHDTATSAHAEFVAVGDLDPVAVKQALERGFGDWTQPAAATQGGTSYVRVPRPWLAVPPARLVVATPDKQNAHLQATLALPINDSHPEYAALMLAYHLFGSGGNSRLWLRIREQEGLSYDVNSDVQWSSVDLHSSWNSSAIFAPQNHMNADLVYLLLTRAQLGARCRDLRDRPVLPHAFDLDQYGELMEVTPPSHRRSTRESSTRCNCRSLPPWAVKPCLVSGC